MKKLKPHCVSVKKVERKLIRLSRGDRIYERLLPSLKGLEGKTVAIDLDQKDVAGVGDSVTEAYRKACEKRPDKKQFYFRVVGQNYLASI